MMIRYNVHDEDDGKVGGNKQASVLDRGGHPSQRAVRKGVTSVLALQLGTAPTRG